MANRGLRWAQQHGLTTASKEVLPPSLILLQ